jgi:hypothetical protein
MKTRNLIITCSLALLATAQGQLTIPGADGSDGALVITENTTIDLSLAVAGDGTTVKWDTENTANAGTGIYDPLKWAVVFKYSSVSIASGATLTFTNHPSRSPVIWLVNGDVTIDGAVQLNGQNHQQAPALAEPGPGGFRGGSATFTTGVTASPGFGPGGGGRNNNSGQAGSFGTATTGPAPYGNPSLLPLIGGSGGAGDQEFTGDRRGGGGGGGALLIAASGTTTVNGSLAANGGAGLRSFAGTDNDSSGGSGGGIRIVTNELAGTGTINAIGGGGWSTGGLGRIRIERILNNNTLSVQPDPSIVPLVGGDTALLFPPASAPTVAIKSISGVSAPADPRASFGTEGADVVVGEVDTVQVTIQTVGVEEASLVQVRLTPRSDANHVLIDAVVDTIVSTDPLIIEWTADVPVGNGYSAVQAKVVRP